VPRRYRSVQTTWWFGWALVDVAAAGRRCWALVGCVPRGRRQPLRGTSVQRLAVWRCTHGGWNSGRHGFCAGWTRCWRAVTWCGGRYRYRLRGGDAALHGMRKRVCDIRMIPPCFIMVLRANGRRFKRACFFTGVSSAVRSAHRQTTVSPPQRRHSCYLRQVVIFCSVLALQRR